MIRVGRPSQFDNAWPYRSNSACISDPSSPVPRTSLVDQTREWTSIKSHTPCPLCFESIRLRVINFYRLSLCWLLSPAVHASLFAITRFTLPSDAFSSPNHAISSVSSNRRLSSSLPRFLTQPIHRAQKLLWTLTFDFSPCIL